MNYTPRFRLIPLTDEQVKPRTAMQILKEVAEKHDLTLHDLRGQNKSPRYAWPRQEAMLRLRDETNLSYTQIARLLHRKDHTTIIFGERAARQRIKKGSEEWQA